MRIFFTPDTPTCLSVLHLIFLRFFGLCPDVAAERARASAVLRALCAPHDATSAASCSSAAGSLPLFAFDPQSEADPAEINFLEKGAWALDAKGVFSLRRHVQAIHSRCCNLVRLDVSDEPALARHAFKLNSWREALGSADDHSSPLQAAACAVEPLQEDSRAVHLLSVLPARPAPAPALWLCSMHTFVFSCWPRTSDCECSVVRLT